MTSLADAASLVLLGSGLRVDLAHQRVWRDGVPIGLRPKAWQALAYLLRRPGELVLSNDLLDALWPGQDISTKTLANLVSELRAALGDDQGPAQLLQTVHRRGYRLQLRTSTASGAAGARAAAPDDPDLALGQRPLAVRVDDGPARLSRSAPGPADRGPPALIGRQTELLRLQLLHGRAAEGQRQLALVTGDPGLGKTALLDHFMQLVASGPAVAARGACLEQHSAREPFAPVLALLADLCGGPLAGQTSVALRRCAPTWLAQMPWLVQPHELPELRMSLAGMGIGRMLREFGALLQALCSHTPLVLVLEDLHWADAATLDLLQQLAFDRAPARLLLLASYQPQLAAQQRQPLARLASRLAAQGLATPLRLKPLADDEVAQRLVQRFAGAPGLQALQPWAMRQSTGIPLYLETALNHLVETGAMAWQADRWQLQAVPDGDDLAEPLRALIGSAFSRLEPATRSLLEAASVVGMQVPVQLLAAVLQQAPAQVERDCNALARQGQFLKAMAPAHWPDGSKGGAYAFTHDIYRRALYDSVAPALRPGLHRRVAERLAAGWQGGESQVAGQLAEAYARAAMPDATARVLELTAQVSVQRLAYGATIDALQACLQQLAQTPATAERAATEIRVQLMLANVGLNHLGLGSPLVRAAFQRAQDLARQTGAMRERVRAQLGETVVLAAGFHPQAARRLALDTVALAEACQPTLVAVAHHYAGMAAALVGELAAACRHQQTALAGQPDPVVPLYFEVHSSARLHLGRSLCLAGQVGEGLAQMEAGLARSRALSTPADLTQKLFWAGDTCRTLGLVAQAAAWLDEARERAEAHDQPGLLAASGLGLAALPEPAERDATLLATLAEAHGRLGDHQATLTGGLMLCETHLAQGRPSHAHAAWEKVRPVVPAGALFEPELLRLQGDICLAGGPQHRGKAEAEACYRAALAVARRQGAGLHVLRSALALARLHASLGQARLAQAEVDDALGQVDAGADWPDHQQAKQLRQQL